MEKDPQINGNIRLTGLTEQKKEANIERCKEAGLTSVGRRGQAQIKNTPMA